MSQKHVLMVPFPMQGHVIPLMELAQHLATYGIKITFVNTDIIHDKIIHAKDRMDDRIRLVSVSDGLEPRERKVPGKMMETVYKIMPEKIEGLIQENYESEEEKITCVIYDQSLGRIQEVATKMGIGSAAFLPAAAALLVLGFNIPKLIEDGIVDNDGTPLKDQMVQFEPTMPIMNTSDFVWTRTKIINLQKLIFNTMIENNKQIKSVDWIVCNSIHDLEPGAFTLAPEIVPIGPLLSRNRPRISQDHFLKQDCSCLHWLDQQTHSSVIYIAFGSSTIFSPGQIQEFAHGLELVDRPFLWALRPDLSLGDRNEVLPEGFLERVSDRGRIIGWAPQQNVLSHRSIGCFLSHCGWNSTVESVSNGVPMLCWPYFADQFINRSYICDIWKIGLKFEEKNDGIVTREEIRDKVDQLFNENVFEERALFFKEMIEKSGKEGGKSYENLKNFIKWIKD